MSRDPRGDWTPDTFADLHDFEVSDPLVTAWLSGALVRKSALLPQLEAADALAKELEERIYDLDEAIFAALRAYLAARDAHLTEGAPDD